MQEPAEITRTSKSVSPLKLINDEVEHTGATVEGLLLLVSVVFGLVSYYIAKAYKSLSNDRLNDAKQHKFDNERIIKEYSAKIEQLTEDYSTKIEQMFKDYSSKNEEKDKNIFTIIKSFEQTLKALETKDEKLIQTVLNKKK